MLKTQIKLLGVLLVVATLCSSTLAADRDALQGKWKADRELQGTKVTFHLEIKQDSFNFELKGGDGATRFVAKGKLKLEKLGPFNTISLQVIEAGPSEKDLQPIADTRSYVYVIAEKVWTLAGNFDRQRENESPDITIYRKE